MNRFTLNRFVPSTVSLWLWCVISWFAATAAGQASSSPSTAATTPANASSLAHEHVLAKKSAQVVRIEKTADRQARILVGDELFTNFDGVTYHKPVLWPLMGPSQIRFSRQWPMETVPGEAHDHPHHKSLWWAHGRVNGVDYWAEKAEISNREMTIAENRLSLKNDWQHAGKTLVTEETILSFSAQGQTRWIDFDIRLTAGAEPVEFGDTKEGFWAIRTHPDLRLTAAPKEGVAEVFGQAENSEGIRGKEIWGRRAAWVAYYGPIDDQPVYVIMLDHPENFRFPTPWHARDYGLVAANPFGFHEFLGEPAGAGNHNLAPGETLRLRYRLVLGQGTWQRELAAPFAKPW